MRALLAVTATLALFAAGCGDDDEPESTSSPATPSGGVAANAVDIKGFAYNPAELTVKVGEKVTWTNSDSAEHDVVADGGTFQSEDLGQGDTFEYTAEQTGTFSYVCSYHPQMKGTLTVE